MVVNITKARLGSEVSMSELIKPKRKYTRRVTSEWSSRHAEWLRTHRKPGAPHYPLHKRSMPTICATCIEHGRVVVVFRDMVPVRKVLIELIETKWGDLKVVSRLLRPGEDKKR
jgi:hypothetical protein